MKTNQKFRGALALLVGVLAGCGCTPSGPQASFVTPLVTPEQRSRMSVEERDDPYTIRHLQTPPVSSRSRR